MHIQLKVIFDPMNLKNTLLIFFIALFSFAQAQLKPIGTWTDHLPFNRGKDLILVNNTFYCSTESGIFTYNTSDNSLEKFSKINLLNDIDLSLIAYSEKAKTLIVTYKNGNIDLIVDGKQVINIPFLKLSNQASEANEIKVVGGLAYISFDFGIMIVDLVKQEIRETIQFGGGANRQINSTQIIGSQIYAASKSGFFKASLNSNLLDFNAWEKQKSFSTSNISSLFEINNQLGIAIAEDTHSVFLENQNGVFEKQEFLSDHRFHSIIKKTDGTFDVYLENKFISLDAEGNQMEEFDINIGGIIKAIRQNKLLYILKKSAPLEVVDLDKASIVQLIKPVGPVDKTVFDMAVQEGSLWTVNGGHDFVFNNSFQFSTLQHLENGEWEVFSNFSTPSLEGVFDMVSVTIDPRNTKNVYISTWGNGIFQYKGGDVFEKFIDSNTNNALNDRDLRDDWVGAGEGEFDEEGNFWVTSPFTRRSLVVRKKDGSWRSFDFSGLINAEETAVFDLEISDEGFKWFTLPVGNSIIVFDDNGTIDNPNDDQAIELRNGTGNGDVPGARGIKIEKDRNGLIWIGTSDGIAVQFNPGNIFRAADKDFDRIIFNDGENNEIVLKNVTIKDMAIDGANRKWIGTENSGIILLSEDGKETIREFNEENSPLPSNTINAIAIDDVSGEVFFATASGLVSYRSEVVKGEESLSKINVFPNPVRSDYTGPITISGLKDNTTVKITDTRGNLVNELRSQGGAVVWDGTNLDGTRVSTGVYLILGSAPLGVDDVETASGKIMFFN